MLLFSVVVFYEVCDSILQLTAINRGDRTCLRVALKPVSMLINTGMSREFQSPILFLQLLMTSILIGCQGRFVLWHFQQIFLCDRFKRANQSWHPRPQYTQNKWERKSAVCNCRTYGSLNIDSGKLLDWTPTVCCWSVGGFSPSFWGGWLFSSIPAASGQISFQSHNQRPSRGSYCSFSSGHFSRLTSNLFIVLPFFVPLERDENMPLVLSTVYDVSIDVARTVFNKVLFSVRTLTTRVETGTKRKRHFGYISTDTHDSVAQSMRTIPHWTRSY